MTPLESHLDPSLIPVLEKIIAPDDGGTMAEADLSFVPKDVGPSFAVYDGSLTHPPCTPAVQWIVSDSVLNVSEDLVRKTDNGKRRNNRAGNDFGKLALLNCHCNNAGSSVHATTENV